MSLVTSKVLVSKIILIISTSFSRVFFVGRARQVWISVFRGN